MILMTMSRYQHQNYLMIIMVHAALEKYLVSKMTCVGWELPTIQR